jgi:hypothetical protein
MRDGVRREERREEACALSHRLIHLDKHEQHAVQVVDALCVMLLVREHLLDESGDFLDDEAPLVP